MSYKYYVYILTNKKNGVLYIGITSNINRRLYEHQNKLIKGFSSKYNLNKLIYCEIYNYVYDALRREKQLKNWKRQWKIDLIEKSNKDWQDLSGCIDF